MKELLGILGLVAVVLAIAHKLEPPQPAVAIDFPLSADPLDDFNLNGGNE